MSIFTDRDGSPKLWLLMLLVFITGIATGFQTSRGPKGIPETEVRREAAYMFCQGHNLGVDKAIEVFDHGHMPYDADRQKMLALKLTDADILQFVKETK